MPTKRPVRPFWQPRISGTGTNSTLEPCCAMTNSHEVMGSFAALQTYAACQDGDEFLSMCAQLIKRLEHIRAMEQPLPANIL